MISRHISLLLLTILLGLCLLKETTGLKCFVCGPDENCDRNYHGQTVNCGKNDRNLYNYQCVKYSIGDAVARGCFLDTFCREQPYCHACDYDYCNGATSSNVVFKLLTFVSTMVLLLSRRI